MSNIDIKNILIIFSFLSFMIGIGNTLLVFINLMLCELDDTYETNGNVVLHCAVYGVTHKEFRGVEKGFYLLPENKQNDRKWFFVEEKYILKKDSHIKRKTPSYKHTYWKVKKDTEVELVSGFFGSVAYEEAEKYNDIEDFESSEDHESLEDYGKLNEVKKEPVESDIDVNTIMVCEVVNNSCLREIIQTNSIEFVKEKWKFDLLSVVTVFYRDDNCFSKSNTDGYEEFNIHSYLDIIFIQRNKIVDLLAGKRVEYEIPLKNKKVITDVYEKDLTNITEDIHLNGIKTPRFVIYAYLITICLLVTGVISFCFCIYIVKPLFKYYHKNKTFTM